MNQNFIIVDDFYDIAHVYHKSILENNVLITDETTQKLSYILGCPIKICEAFNEVGDENHSNQITTNTAFKWLSLIHISEPTRRS